jgi:hypothetical protein
LPNSEKRKKLNQTLDRVTKRFGRGVLRRAVGEETKRANVSKQIKRGEEN